MSFQPAKCDPELGAKVHEYLVSKGVETPMVIEQVKKKSDAKIKKIEKAFTSILEELGMDLTDDSLEETPRRVAKMYVQERFWGLSPEHFPKCTAVDNKMKYDEMVVEKCSINSMCEHHLVYFGSLHNRKMGCWIAYIPNEKVIGLSKLSRIAEYFSARPQIQERLVEQISLALQYILETENVAVLIKAQHFCVLTRGVSDPDSFTITSKLSGSFMSNMDVRKEFLSIVNGE